MENQLKYHSKKKITTTEKDECSNSKKKTTKAEKDECSDGGVSLVLVTVVICLRVRNGNSYLCYNAPCLERINRAFFHCRPLFGLPAEVQLLVAP